MIVPPVRVENLHGLLVDPGVAVYLQILNLLQPLQVLDHLREGVGASCASRLPLGLADSEDVVETLEARVNQFLVRAREEVAERFNAALADQKPEREHVRFEWESAFKWLFFRRKTLAQMKEEQGEAPHFICSGVPPEATVEITHAASFFTSNSAVSNRWTT